jgi:AraC-like DNA-binding protein
MAQQGERSIDVDGRQMCWGERLGSLYLPAGTPLTPGTGRALDFLWLPLDLSLLITVARAMRPDIPSQRLDLQTRRARVLPLDVGGIPLRKLVRHVTALGRLYGQDAQLLQALGLRELIYRHLVLLFRPDWLLASTPSGAPMAHKRRAVDRVCDLLLQDLSRTTSLADMAAHAHMSVRSLQYAFQSRFGMSPLDWLRGQRLALARDRLLHGEHAGITHLAHACGFGSASRFAATYRQRYGEAPSATALRFAQSAPDPAQAV